MCRSCPPPNIAGTGNKGRGFPSLSLPFPSVSLVSLWPDHKSEPPVEGVLEMQLTVSHSSISEGTQER